VAESQGGSGIMPLADPTASETTDQLHPVIEQVIDQYGSLETRYERLRHAYASLMENQIELLEQVRTAHDIHLITDSAGHIVQASPSACLLAPLDQLQGSLLEQWVADSSHAQLLALLAPAQAEQAQPCSVALLSQATATPSIPATVQRVSSDKSGARQLHWVLRPDPDALEPALPIDEALAALDRNEQAAMTTNASGIIVAVNAGFAHITGYSADEAIGKNPSFLHSGLQDDDFYRDFWQELHDTGAWQGHVFNRRKSGDIYSQWMVIKAAKDAQGRVLQYQAVLHDLSAVTSKKRQRLAQSLPPNVYRTQASTSMLGELGGDASR